MDALTKVSHFDSFLFFISDYVEMGDLEKKFFREAFLSYGIGEINANYLKSAE